MDNELIIDRDDILIARIAADEADATEWRTFELDARQRPQSWERLARTLRDELQMRGSLERELSNADQAEIPAEAFEPPVIQIRRWSGWAVAAAIALIWVGVGVMQPNRPSSGMQTAGLPNVVHAANPDEALDHYVDLGTKDGRVLEQLPMMMLEVRSLDDASGSVEVLYVRQILERARVNGAFEFQRDDRGRRVLVPSQLASYARQEQ